MVPWYRAFKGEIEFFKSGTYRSLGVYEKIDDTTLWITELPIGEWTHDYKVKLEKMLVAGTLEDFKEHHTDTDVSFTLYFTESQMKKLEQAGIEKELKLFSYIHFSNMTLFNGDHVIKTYATPQEIIKDFYAIRKDLYVKRKKFLLKLLQKDFDILDNKVRFILEVINNTLVIKKRKKVDLLKELKEKGYGAFPTASKKKSEEEENENEDENNDDEDTDQSAYNYLLKMPLWSLTLERVEQLKKKKEEKGKEVKVLEETTEDELWLRDLDNLEKQYEIFETAFDKEFRDGKKTVKKPVVSKAIKKKIEKKDHEQEKEDAKKSPVKETVTKRGKKEPAKKKEPAVKKETVKKDPAVKKEPVKKRTRKEPESGGGLLGMLQKKMGIEINAEDEDDEDLPDPKKKKLENFKDDSFHSLSGSDVEISPKKPAPKKRVMQPKKTQQTKITSFANAPTKLVIDDEEKKVSPKPRRQLAKKSDPVIVDEEEEEEEEVAPVITKPRATRGRKPVKVVEEIIDSEEDEIIDDDNEEEESFVVDDDDDFEFDE